MDLPSGIHGLGLFGRGDQGGKTWVAFLSASFDCQDSWEFGIDLSRKGTESVAWPIVHAPSIPITWPLRCPQVEELIERKR